MFCAVGWITPTQAALASSVCQQRHCIAVVDAGSTGSRLHVYAYDLDSTHTPVRIEQIGFQRIHPGLASVETSSTQLDDYLSKLFANAPDKNIPVYFYATAGMRFLSPTLQEVYYQHLQQWFNRQTQWKLQAIKTITGKQEGLYSWLAVNYKLGFLQAKGKELAGVMDMGGGSVQIVFPVNGSNTGLDLETIRVYGRSYTLFNRSFLGLGNTEITHQFLDSPGCFPLDFPMPNGARGSGDSAVCRQETEQFLNNVHGVSTAVKSTLLANPVSTWYALGAIPHLLETKPFEFGQHHVTNQQLLDESEQRICKQAWSALRQDDASNHGLYTYCLQPSYYYTLMVNGYGIDPQMPIHFLPTQEAADWTLGVVFCAQTVDK